MEWKIIEYETIREERPVAEFIKKQQPKAIAKITHIIDLKEKLSIFFTALKNKDKKRREKSWRQQNKGICP